VKQARANDSSLTGIPVNVGFHAVPSMRRLHCHVISTDFNAAALKTKVHWNSFTSDFFLPLSDVLAALEGPHGRVATVDAASAEASCKGDELRCHRCSCILKTMPMLKDHILECAAPLPRGRAAVALEIY